MQEATIATATTTATTKATIGMAAATIAEHIPSQKTAEQTRQKSESTTLSLFQSMGIEEAAMAMEVEATMATKA